MMAQMTIELQEKTADIDINENQPENILVEANHDLSANPGEYYAICNPSGKFLNRVDVGNDGVWDYEHKMWFFEFEEDAKKVISALSEKASSLSIKKLTSNIVHKLLNGSEAEIKAIKLRCAYSIANDEFEKKEIEFKAYCQENGFPHSVIIYGDHQCVEGGKERLYKLLRLAWEKLEPAKISLNELREKCEKAEEKARSCSLPKKYRKRKDGLRIPQNGLPNIKIVPGQLHISVNEAEKILTSKDLGIFQRGGQLVRIVSEISKPKKNKLYDRDGKEIIKRSADSLLIVEVDTIFLSETLGKNANWFKFNERTEGWVVKDCPRNIAETLLARREWDTPVLRGIIQAPTLRQDGSILDSPGYDEITGLFFNPGDTKFLEIPSHPSKEDAIVSLNLLRDLLKDFPFENEESESVTVSAILTGLIRKSIRTAPLHGFTAPKMGSGKSLLADIVGLIATGKNNCVIPQADSEAEEKKRLLAVLSEGDAIICYDNIEHPFGSPALCSVLTQEEYKDRLLGSNRSLSVPTNATFLATGNNLTFIGDTSTRAILCRLDPQCERPEERVFDVDLRKLISQNRGELVKAALIILRAYHVADRPKQNIAQYGRFEDWSNWIRSALVWLGMSDPCVSRKEIENADPTRVSLSILLAAWYDYLGDLSYTLKKAISKAEQEKSEHLKEKSENFLDALCEISSERSEINTRSLGKKFASFKGRIENGFRLEKSGKSYNIDTWRVKKIHDSK